MKTSEKYFFRMYGVQGKGAVQSEVKTYGEICHIEGIIEATQPLVEKIFYQKQLEQIEIRYNLNYSEHSEQKV